VLLQGSERLRRLGADDSAHLLSFDDELDGDPAELGGLEMDGRRACLGDELKANLAKNI